MKTRTKTWVNVLMAAVLGLLGFGGTVACKYGVLPNTTFKFEGQVTNENQEPLEGIQIERYEGYEEDNQYYWGGFAYTLYTDTAGRFFEIYEYTYPAYYQRIVAADTSGVYEVLDTIVTPVYEVSDRSYESDSYLNVNLVMKKK